MKKKIIRVSTIPMSLKVLLKGQLNFLNKFYKIIAVSGKGKSLRKVENREGVDVFPITMKRSISPINDFISLWRLYLFFKREKPIIVHSITPKAGLLSMIAGYFCKVPIRVHTFTGLVFPYKRGYMQKLLIFTDKILCKCATNIYPEGVGVKNDLLKFKITKKPLKILANGNVNGINIDYFSRKHFSKAYCNNLKKKIGVNEKDFVYIFVGRLVSDKGINELITAFQNINNRKIKNLKLLLIGPFEQNLDPLKLETLDSINSDSNIISVGFQDDVRPYFAISNVLVFPSYREGFPNVVMQAGSMELPSIVTDINGCNEIIVNEENGLIISAKNTNELEKAMMRCISNRILLDRMMKNARPMIENRYQQKLVWDSLLTEYKKLEQEYYNKKNSR